MNIDRLSSLVSRVFFGAAFILLALAVAERTALAFGYTITGGTPGGRLLEIAVSSLVFVIALLLRQIRQELKQPRSS